ncbi:MAG: D-alanyl-D-alanine carboxypeptidase [Endozoicomonadaceae bacterium]|nr:D-alanyl-D-alanine carboxypeptidase [Endozoicomonadaceae bacterium]
MLITWPGFSLVKTSSMQIIKSIAPEAPQTNAEAFVLMDFQTKKIIAQKNLSKRMSPASITKLMTAYIVDIMLQSGRIKWTDLVPISEKAWRIGGSTMFLTVNESVSVAELIKGLIVVSGNDAGIALAEFIAGNESLFVKMMNETVKALNLKNTHFEDVNGLSPLENHYSSVEDLAYLSRHIIQDFPESYEIYSMKSYQHGMDLTKKIPLNPQPNRVKLLHSPEWQVDGLKTGYTQNAGYCQAISAVKNGVRRIVVILNADTLSHRDQDASRLLRYSYQFFDNVKIFSKETVQSVPVIKGQKNTINVAVQADVWDAVLKGESDFKTQLHIVHPLSAPIKKDQKLGEISVLNASGDIMKTVPVFAVESVELGSIFKRFWDFILTLF